jgi:hypothetical protein
MTVGEALAKEDMDEIIDSMTAYVFSCLKFHGIKNLEGKTPFDFVAEVLMKIVENERDWSKAKCSFREFLFGSLRSHLYNFNKTFRKRFVDELPEQAGTEDLENTKELEKIAYQTLKDGGSNDDELEVFRCWVEGITKPADIAHQMNTNVKDIYNIIKRLERKLPSVRSKFTSLYE